MFGDIVKVTPSSKVVGDLALYMVANNLTAKDIFEKGETVSFPQSVIGFFKGDLGQPHNGFPQELQKIILKDVKPYTDLPNAHLEPVDFDKEFEQFKRKFDKNQTFLDFLSYKFYPKVFEEFYQHKQNYGNVSVIPSPQFFYGMQNNEEAMFEMDNGKSIIVKLMYSTEPDENGIRTVYFKLNGQTRGIEVKDLSVTNVKASKVKATDANHVGSPLQGMLSKIFVREGDLVKKNTPLFTIEAMKMESTVSAIGDGKVKKIVLNEGTLIEPEDLIIELEK
jgi:pyruvate carboxylase